LQSINFVIITLQGIIEINLLIPYPTHQITAFRDILKKFKNYKKISYFKKLLKKVLTWK